MNLVLHCGARHVDRDVVESCPTPEPTHTWHPIPHHRLLDQVESTLAGAGLRVASAAHALSADRCRYFGLLEVVNGQSHQDYNLVLGVRNSHDKSFPASLAIGNAVFVCDNLSFSGEITIARRHTRFIMRDLPGLVSSAIGQLGDLRRTQDHRIARYKETELSDRDVHDLVVRSLDARVLPVTKVPDVINEWRHPRHPEFAADGRTAWRFFNSVTEAIKGRLDALPRRTQALHGLLDAACGIEAALPN